MRLKSIIIDGFKSYAHRQELADLDSHFNAITGFNGSGKSNIFDAICFVMGISNLKKVRAEDPSELIYKNGHAGIQRASVTIEFLNNDRRTAPTGYSVEEFPVITISRQILTGGRQKFFLNGRVSDQSKVKQFFHAVSLNVDNPHFLVLQGTVHKLVNMRPAEILGMLEEAAGTRVFDARRRNAENMIIGKERKVQQLNQTIDAEIGPMLHTMKDAQDVYAKYMEVVESLEGLRKFKVAHGYWSAANALRQSVDRKKEIQEHIATGQRSLEALPRLRRDAENRLADLQLSCTGPEERIKGGEEEGARVRTEQNKANGKLNVSSKNVKAVQRTRKQLETEANAVTTELESFVTGAQSRQEARRELVAKRDQATEAVQELKASIGMQKAGVRAGMGGKTLEEEHNHLRREQIRAKQELSRREQRDARIADEIAGLQRDLATAAAEHGRMQLQLEQAERQLAEDEKAFAPFRDLRKQRDQAQVDRDKWARGIERLEVNQPRSILDMPKYDHVPGYDFELALHGRVAGLVRVLDPAHSYALSVGAGGKLLNVVIAEDRLIPVLIKEGRLRQRTTFLPLNKLQNHQPAVDPRRMEAAAAIAAEMGGFAKNCATLVRYEPEFTGVVQKAFGDTVLCSSMEIAKAVANDRRCALKCVTLEGDTVNPNGVMTGGSRGNMRDLLQEAANYDADASRQARVRLADAVRRVQDLDAEIRKGESVYHQLQQSNARVEGLRQRLRESTAENTKKRIQELEAERAESAEAQRRATAYLKTTTDRLAEIESTKDADPEVLLRLLEDKLKAAETHARELVAKVKAGDSDFRGAEDHRAELEARLKDLKGEIAEKDAELTQLEEDERQAKADVERCTQRLQSLQEKMRADEETLARLHEQCEEAKAEVQRHIDQEHDLARRVKDFETEMRSFAKTVEDTKKHLQTMERAHAFIASEKDTFGGTDGAYYFDDEARTEETLQRLRESEAVSEAMSRKVNKKATVQYEECRQQYADIVEKRSTLQADKETIMETIRQVEERKWSSLDQMVAKVSEGFSRLFAACLPNASAKLVDERDATTGRLTGVAVKVAFSGKEKESLTELSGGQRSLLALCLILAILRFRPAPMYILDEVDAALDPSHTQNIGRMLKEHFSDAQFLLVSLKDGMFSNANVVYQIRNTQGYSEITRVAAPRR